MNIIRKLRATFESCPTLRIMDLQEKLADEPPSSISMGLLYLYKQRYCTRVKVKSTRKYGRKMVYEYTYSNIKLPKVMIGLIKEANNGTETTYTDR